MKNKTTEEKILLISDYVFKYLETFAAVLATFFILSYGIGILQNQTSMKKIYEGYFFLSMGIFSIFFYPLFLSFMNKIFKREQPNKYLKYYTLALFSMYLIVTGIIDLQTTHYPEENYVYFGKTLIVIGILGILYAKWRYKINKRKENN